jgi:hypothetical protein
MMHDLWDAQIANQMRELVKEKWTQRARLSGVVEIPQNFKFEVYRDALIGLNEIVRGLLEFFPHKTTVVFVRGTTPKISSFMAGLARDGIITKEISFELAQEDAAAALAACDADTLMVVSGSVDPLSSRKFQLEAFRGLLISKKIFSVELFPSPDTLDFSTAPSPYRAQLVSVGPSLAVALVGSRAKGPTLIMGDPYFGPADLKNLSTKLEDADRVAKSVVQDFEQKLPGGAVPFFKDGESRIFDRAVLTWPGIDGYAICELLCERKGWSLDEAPESVLGTRMDTGSGCRWSEWNGTAWLRDQGYADEVTRGMVIFSAALLHAEPLLAQELDSVCAQLRELQDG